MERVVKEMLTVVDEIAERLLGGFAAELPLGRQEGGDVLVWRLGRMPGVAIVGEARGKGESIRDVVEDIGEAGDRP